MNTRVLNFTLSLALAVCLIGCGAGSDPTGAMSGASPQSSLSSSSGRVVWGVWQCYMEPGGGRIEAVPLRGPMFTANVNNLLEAKPGNLLIQDLDFTDFATEGRIDCTITLKHPLPGVDMYHGFDVWGVFMHNGATSLGYDGLTYSGGPGAGENEAVLLNPDGFTRWFNWTEFNGPGLPLLKYWPGRLSNLLEPTATLNPYKVFADDLAENDDFYEWATAPGNTDDRGIYRAGMVRSRRYELKFPIIGGIPKVDFQYAVIATWEPGDPALTGNPALYDPFDFPPSANCEEPFLVHVSTLASDVWYQDSENLGGTFRADLEVFDWQGGIAAGNGVLNEIHRVIFEGDFLPGGSYEFGQGGLAPLAIAGTSNSSVFQVEIGNCVPQASGDADLWVIVEAAGLNGESYYQGFPGIPYPEGARRAAFLPGSVKVGTEPSIPENVEYNFIISTQRSGSGLIEGIKLEWDQITYYPMCNIYKKSAYDPGSDWELLPASPVSESEYVDTDFLTYEGYMYYIAGTNGTIEIPPSQVAFILMDDAEETVNTFSIWEDAWRQMGSLFERWGPLGAGPHSPPPANGSFSWDESAIENLSTYPGDFWTGFWMLLCSPVLPLDEDNHTAYVEFMCRIQTYEMLSWPDGYFAGGKVGVCAAVDNDEFYPSDEYRSGFEYPIDDVGGLWRWGHYPHCGEPEAGYADDYNYWQLTSYYMSDVFTISSPRVGFAFGACNCALGYGWNVDDIAIIIY
jgi:hypothetical protein